MTLEIPSLAGLSAGLSVSAQQGEMLRKGYTDATKNRFAVRLGRALLSHGAGLVFGHGWRTDGVMHAMLEAVVDYRSARDRTIGIRNLMPWPYRTRLDAERQRELAEVLVVEEAGLPEDVDAAEATRAAENPEQLDYLYFRSRALTRLRHRLAESAHARICLGGRVTEFEGRYPGILEEAWLSLQAGRPIYLIGLLGGSAEILAEAVFGPDERPSAFGVPLDAASLRRQYSRRHPSALPLSDHGFDLDRTWSDFLRLAREALRTEDAPASNGLTEAENRRLLRTSLEDEAVFLVLKGLSTVARVRSASRPPRMPPSHP